MSQFSVQNDIRPLRAPRLHLHLFERYRQVRRFTEELCGPLILEDYGVQSMPDVSPPKWHLAHTTWFFEEFVLLRHLENYRPYNSRFRDLFNSYYLAVCEPWSRARRGMLSRPSVDEIYRYRKHADQHMLELMDGGPRGSDPLAEPDWLPAVTLGLHHEQQHQELLLTDIKHIFWSNGIRPVYRARPRSDLQTTIGYLKPDGARAASIAPLRWVDFPGGLAEIGHDLAPQSFGFDNESPRHRVWLEAFSLGSRLITNGEYLEFMKDGGYANPLLWLSDGWAAKERHGWNAPLYWERAEGPAEDHDDAWTAYTLNGAEPVRPADPVCHVSYYEADAFARWRGARLPSEAEWEVAAAAASSGAGANLLESGTLHPRSPGPRQAKASELTQMLGDVWEWTSSSYAPYPGFRPLGDELGEYNGKFMVNQMVLRGGSCATPLSHIRVSYRNFFGPEARWQFSGIRLAR